MKLSPNHLSFLEFKKVIFFKFNANGQFKSQQLNKNSFGLLWRKHYHHFWLHMSNSNIEDFWPHYGGGENNVLWEISLTYQIWVCHSQNNKKEACCPCCQDSLSPPAYFKPNSNQSIRVSAFPVLFRASQNHATSSQWLLNQPCSQVLVSSQ